MSLGDLAERISAVLQLRTPPIALTVVESAPAGIRTFEDAVPAPCTLWRRAEAQVFYAPAAAHFNCPIGAMTMGFDLPASVHQDIEDLVAKMHDCGYVCSSQEPHEVISIAGKKSGVVYGPLKEFPLRPDAVIMWLTPRQTIPYSKAAGSATWTDSLPTAVFGRPACAALPVALNDGQSSLSMGCLGMRTYTEISDDRLLAVLPGRQLEKFCRNLEADAKPTATMRAIYEAQRAKYQDQGRPK